MSPEHHFVIEYQRHVEQLLADHPLDHAMSLAVGGAYEEIGKAQVDILQEIGLTDRMSLVDLGCGSGRTAVKLAGKFPSLQYLGVDVVQSLLDYAADKCPAHFRFVRHCDLNIPADDSSADMVIAFSVFTHLLHEESFRYMVDAFRVLRPGGYFVASILEFAKPSHWPIFESAVDLAGKNALMTTFLEASALKVWACRAGFADFDDSRSIGQTVAVMRKP